MAIKTFPPMPLAFTRLMEDFQHSFQNFERLHEMQRRNLAALMEMNQISLEAAEGFARRQADIMRRTTEIFAAAAMDALHAKSPSEIAERQLAVARDTFLMTQTELRSLARMTVETQNETNRVYAGRVTDTLDAIEATWQGRERR